MDGERPASFGALLRRHRLAAGLTQMALAGRAELSARGIAFLERGARRPYPDTVRRLAEALALTGEERAAFMTASQAETAAAGGGPPSAPLPTADAAAVPTGNLPAPLTSLVGRTQERVAVLGLLESSRLVTLTGTGGIGKTRLALAVAADLVDHYAGGVWLVELAPLAEAVLVPVAVARALNLEEEAQRPLLATLIDRLKGRRLLLLLDNCEHLVAACAALVEALLRGCPEVRVLATSRETLRVPGERTFRVPALPLPRVDAPVDPEALPADGAVELFLQRARDRLPDFALRAHNVESVVAICARLDGIPLAIELAAARVGVLSVAAIAARLDARFALLTEGPRTALPRQQTLRATLDWSYALLDAAEQALLRRLAVFSNGWTLSAAEAVCQGKALPALAVLDALAALVTKSLVQHIDNQHESRYAFLETVQQYARDRLIDAGEEQSCRDGHLRWCLVLSVEAAPGLLGQEQAAWLVLLDGEHDNLRAALTWALARGAAEDALRLSGALWRYWAARGYHSEGRRWLEAALAAGGTVSDASRATALNGAGNLAWQQGDYGRATVLHEEALALRRAMGDTRGTAGSLGNLGTVAYRQGNYRLAATLYEEALAGQRKLEDRWGIAATLNNLAMVAYQRGDYTRAATLYEEGLALQRELQDEKGVAGSLDNLGLVMSRLGDHAQAVALQDEALAMQRSLGYTWGAAVTLSNLSLSVARHGDPVRAAALGQESLTMLREIGDTHSIAASLCNLGEIAAMQGDYARALALYGESSALQRRMGDTHGSTRSLINLGTLAYVQGNYQQGTSLFAQGLACARDIGARDQQAEGLEGLAWVAAASGWAQRAARLGGAAYGLREVLDAPLQMGREAAHEHAVQRMRAALDEQAFAAAWADGLAMPLADALALALNEELAGDREGDSVGELSQGRLS